MFDLHGKNFLKLMDFSAEEINGLLELAAEGAFRPEDRILFLHSGGAGGLFAIQ